MSNWCAGLMTPMVDRPCVERREVRQPAPAVKPVKEVLRKHVVKPRRRMEFVDNPWGLSRGQCSVMPLIVDGLSYEEVAASLGINAKTVESHLGRLREKMGVRSTLSAALKWDRWQRANKEAA